jgi:hypothetical protein
VKKHRIIHPLPSSTKDKTLLFLFSPPLSICRELQSHSSSLFFYLLAIPCISTKSLPLTKPKHCPNFVGEDNRVQPIPLWCSPLSLLSHFHSHRHTHWQQRTKISLLSSAFSSLTHSHKTISLSLKLFLCFSLTMWFFICTYTM